MIVNNNLAIKTYNNNLKIIKHEKHKNLDGSEDKRTCHKETGIESEVFAFNKPEEIQMMIKTFNNHIENSKTDFARYTARKNKLLFLVGINLGIRGSDLREIKWSFFFDENGEFRKYYSISPIKQRKQHKFVRLYFNEAVKYSVNDYVKNYPITDYNEYVFKSRKGNDPIAVGSLWRIIKETAKEAGIEKNIGSHSLRKTWGYWCWHEAKDKNKALVVLQKCFNHSSSLTTMKYIGLLNEEIEEMYNSVNLGIEIVDEDSEKNDF